MSLALGLALESQTHHLFYRIVSDLAWGTRARLIRKTLDPYVR